MSAIKEDPQRLGPPRLPQDEVAAVRERDRPRRFRGRQCLPRAMAFRSQPPEDVFSVSIHAEPESAVLEQDRAQIQHAAMIVDRTVVEPPHPPPGGIPSR